MIPLPAIGILRKSDEHPLRGSILGTPSIKGDPYRLGIQLPSCLSGRVTDYKM